MEDSSKLILSVQELRIVEDTQWILTKRDIIQKVYHLFNRQIPVIGNYFLSSDTNFPAKIRAAIPKISRGENYNGLPYVILDYPSVFEKDNIFALRTMFWWGNFFSASLLLSGIYKDKFAEIIYNNSDKIEAKIFICVHESPWQHHFEPSNFIKANEMEKAALEKLLLEREFVKVALMFDLKQWNNIESLLKTAYDKIFCIIKD